jgi:hypothetical protein
MPYKKVGSNDYVSPNGTHINSAQLQLWHAGGEKWPGQKTAEHKTGGSVMFAKGEGTRDAHYAQGGPVLGRTRDFVKAKEEPDVHFRENTPASSIEPYNNPSKTQDYGSKGSPAKRTGDKALTAVKPRT